MYTILAPKSPWLGSLKTETLLEAIQRKAAWKIYQNAHAVILDENYFIVSSREQIIELANILVVKTGV